MARKNRYTIFDLMDDRGVFEKNPANAVSPQYAGPIPYPKMLYHPMGELRVTQKSETLMTPYGPKEVGEQKELISRIVQDAEEEEVARAEGWHDHPAKAIAASGKPAPAVGSPLVTEKDREIEKLRKELEEARKAMDAFNSGKKVAA
jgi:hypothetical protein